MPKSKNDLTNFGLWPSSELPRSTVYKLLRHLNEPGVHLAPRLYVERRPDGAWRAGLSNSDKSTGFQSKVDVSDMIRDGLVEFDRARNSELQNTQTLCLAYRISDKGREAIAQVEARDFIFRFLLRKEIPAALCRFRKKAGLKDPARE